MSIVQRVYPAEGAQLDALTMYCDHARFVYNVGLEQRSCWTLSRRHFRQKITVASQMRDLTEARREFDWLRAGSTVVPQGAVRDLDLASVNFLVGGAGFELQETVRRPAGIRRARSGGAANQPPVGRDSGAEGRVGAVPDFPCLGRHLCGDVGLDRIVERSVDGEPDDAAGTASGSVHHGGGEYRSGCGEFDLRQRRPDVSCPRILCGGTGSVRGPVTTPVPAAEGFGEPGPYEGEVGAVAPASGRSSW
nr:hypothetical protein [Rhodococcus sp. OK302]